MPFSFSLWQFWLNCRGIVVIRRNLSQRNQHTKLIFAKPNAVPFISISQIVHTTICTFCQSWDNILFYFLGERGRDAFIWVNNESIHQGSFLEAKKRCVYPVLYIPITSARNNQERFTCTPCLSMEDWFYKWYLIHLLIGYCCTIVQLFL